MPTPAAELLMYGTIPAVTLCAASWIQRRAWRRPARDDAEAHRRAAWTGMFPLPHLGVRVAGGFVYTSAGRCLGQAAAATAAIVPSVPVTRLKPSTGHAVITFADGTVHRHLIGLRNLPAAQAEADRFNKLVKGTAQATFRRTWTRPQHAHMP